MTSAIEINHLARKLKREDDDPDLTTLKGTADLTSDNDYPNENKGQAPYEVEAICYGETFDTTRHEQGEINSLLTYTTPC